MSAIAVPSKTKINRSGDRLREWWVSRDVGLIDTDEELRAAARVLFDYRESFQGPLKKVTVGVRQFVQRESAYPVVVGQRLKRAPQIIKKLCRFGEMKLARMQDIGGCRAVLGGGAAEVDGVLRRIRKNQWDVRGFKDYTKDPAPSGYRAVHVVVMRDEHLIEIQLRTPLQQAWAEAVERTALRTRFDLKEGEGPADLLEFFRLAGIGLALEERGENVDEDFTANFEAVRDQVQHYFERRT